jgi:uncharacterized protein (DUF433 family)
MDLPDFLTRDADGEIRLTGHRIGLYTVARLRQEGRSAEQIATELPSLSRSLIDRVLAFYEENRAAVDAYVAEYRQELERQAAALPGPGVRKMRQQMERLRQADAQHGSDPTWLALPIQEKLRRLESETPREPV